MAPEKLIAAAREAQNNSYSHYSGFKVGAALLTAGGNVYTGVNVENASYGLTICAERSAIFTAVTAGEKEFSIMAVTGDQPGYTYPCGPVCRLWRITVPLHNKYFNKEYHSSRLLPQLFFFENQSYKI